MERPTKKDLKKARVASLKIWWWLLFHPSKDKSDLPGNLKRLAFPSNRRFSCPLCNVFDEFKGFKPTCSRCPLSSCFGEGAFYSIWVDSYGNKGKRILAALRLYLAIWGWRIK